MAALQAVPVADVPVMPTVKPLLVTVADAPRSGLMNAEPPDGPLPRMSSVWAYMPLAQLAANVDCALPMARSEPIADASLPEIRARNRPGTAIAAMMPMIATTISSSINVNPSCFRSRIGTSFLEKSVKRHPEDAIDTAIEVPSRGYIERYGREIAGWARALRDPGRRAPRTRSIWR